MRRSGGERWRWQTKAALASAIAWSFTRSRIARRRQRTYRPLILGYHRVVADFATAAKTEMPSMLTSLSMFERHLDWLGQHFRFASVDEIGERVLNDTPFTEPVVAITFDDGYRDVYEQAFPVLKRRGIPAAMFVVTSLVGQPSWQMHDRLYRVVARAFAKWEDPRRELFAVLTDVGIPPHEVLRERSATRTPTTVMTTLLPRLSQADVGRVIRGLNAALGNEAGSVPLTLRWDDLANMRRSVFTIGSHTESHVSLPMESPETITAELEGSKRTLEDHLGEPVRHFAYPGGQFTQPVVEAAHRAGYQFAYTACPHGDERHPSLTMERLLLWEGSSVDADGTFSSDIFNCQTNRLWLPALRCEREHV